MDGVVKISARGMARIRVDGKLLIEIGSKTDRPQAIGGGILAFPPGREYLSSIGFHFKESEWAGGTDLRGAIDRSLLPGFEEWFVRSRIEANGQRELDPVREMIEELSDEGKILPGLVPEDIIARYLWTAKPALEDGNKQRYLEIHEVAFRSPRLYDQLKAALPGQQRYVLVDEAGLAGSDSKLLSLVMGHIPLLAGAIIAEDYR